ncbi:transposase [Synechococcus sp. CBW1107]|uniref:transposase n=1 Tax=Synechococcus sp. CBW1107 TaxID=2789857 RepID=UPI001E51FDE0|nr:transposase [Synechococcus sp. CBW1107]
MGQRGFWDEQQRVAKLKEKKPVLQRLSESIPWDSFRPLLDKGYVQERKTNAGRKRIDPLILFKILVLQQLFNLSDEELEFQVNDRRSFEEFVGLGVMNSIPDATTVAFFRERLRKAEVIEEFFEMFEAYLRSQGAPSPRWPDHRCNSCSGSQATQYPRGEQRSQSREAAGALG